MSISSLTSIAAVRDQAKPTKGHIGKQSTKDDDAASPASRWNMLVSSIPTELVAPYTALTAAIVASVAKATRANPHPDHYERWRWGALALLALGTAGMVWVGALRKGSTRKVPLLEIATSVVAAIGWALALPNSPLTPHLAKGERTFVPLFIAFAAGIVALLLAGGLKQQPRARRRRRRRPEPTRDTSTSEPATVPPA